MFDLVPHGVSDARCVEVEDPDACWTWLARDIFAQTRILRAELEAEEARELAQRGVKRARAKVTPIRRSA